MLKNELEFNTPILFLVFNRIETTKKVFKSISAAKPPRLYIASDGPRPNRLDDIKNVKEVRDFINQNINWDCELNYLFRDTNLGCKDAVSEAITWFFENEEQGIILEDDCLPSDSFYLYCQELLNKYKYNEDIYLISGDGRSTNNFKIRGDYAFIKYPLIWGWASWSRVWRNYDKNMIDWPNYRNTLPNKISNNHATRVFWKDMFNRMYLKSIDTWDYQFSYLVLKNSAKCIIPAKNLISNIGFGLDATHTKDKSSSSSNVLSYEITIPLKEDISLADSDYLNSFYDKHEFSKKSFFERVMNKLKLIFFK